jgi:deoxyribonuclease-4
MESRMKAPLLGVHCSVAGGLENAFAEANALGIDAVQIFTQNQRQWINKVLPEETVHAFKAAWRSSSVKTVFSHCSYLLNLGSEDDALFAKSVDTLEGEARRCHALGLMGCVLHPGAAKGQSEDAALSRIAEGLQEVLRRTPDCRSHILLENTAGQGTSLGYRFSHLAVLLKKVRSKRLGICFDTCHAFAAGYDLRDEKSFQSVWKEFDQEIGLDRLEAIHLNDSRGGLGSRIDRHEHIGKGELGAACFRRMLIKFPDIPKVLETDKEDDMDRRNLDYLHKLVA